MLKRTSVSVQYPPVLHKYQIVSVIFFNTMFIVVICFCVVDGGWSDFGDWSECSATCGGAIKERRRTCTSPPPSNGGACCVGDNVEAERCNTESCKEEIGR